MSSNEKCEVERTDAIGAAAQQTHKPLARLHLNRTPAQLSTKGPNAVICKNGDHAVYYISEGFVRATSGTVVIITKGKVIANSGSTVIVYPGVEVVKAHPKSVVIKIAVDDAADAAMQQADKPLLRLHLNRTPAQFSTKGPNAVICQDKDHAVYSISDGFVRATSGTVVIVKKGKAIANSGSTLIVYPGVEVVKSHPKSVVIKISVE